MGPNPSRFKAFSESCPVDRVSWYDVVRYANAVTRKAGLAECYRSSSDGVTFTGLGCSCYRMPTKAEGERAA